VINFTRAFSTAWERMSILLFQPFRLEKWAGIGFSAFLAGLLVGGNGKTLSFQTDFDPSDWKNAKFNFSSSGNADAMQQLHGDMSHMFNALAVGMSVAFVALVVVVALAILMVLYWLGARGQFMFLDNLVRNRASISEPWERYAAPANQFFWFYLLLQLGLYVVLGVFVAIGVSVVLPMGGLKIVGIGLLGFVAVVVWAAIELVLLFYREWGTAIMFRTGATASRAFFVTMALLPKHAGSVAAYLGLRVAMFIAEVVLCYTVCCVSLCTYSIPYLGTVFVLPMLIYVRCFTLDCLAQMEPGYDAFTVDVAP
jgi:hypothetical protein